METGDCSVGDNEVAKKECENYQLLANKAHLVITELMTATENKQHDTETNGIETHKESPKDTAPNDKEETKKRENEDDKFYIEEPFDFVFEPDHYPKFSDKNLKASDDESEKSKGRFAQAIREDDGVVEYEYKYYTYDRSFYTNKLNDDLDSIYFEGFNSFVHMRGGTESTVRAVSMSRWPGVGFGFTLDSARIGSDLLIYINRIDADTPAELSSLRLGDILIELDDETPNERFSDDHDASALLAHVNEYIARRDNLHLVVVHDSHYARLKAENNDDLLKNYYFNCEDIVVVNMLKYQENQQHHQQEQHTIH